MLQKTVWFLVPLAIVFLFASGCFAPAQFGAPERTIVRGTVAMPERNSCFGVVCSQPQVSEGHVPVPQADLTLYGEAGDLLTLKTDACGQYEASGLRDACYVLYAHVPGGSARVKKGFIVEAGKVNDVGEANVYTTAQVIIYEVAVEQYGKEVVKCSDIPRFVPTPALLEAVRSALLRCHDPQKDCTVLTIARSIAANYFGAPGGGGEAAGGGGAGGGNTPGDGGATLSGSITVKLYCDNPCNTDSPVSGATVTVEGGSLGESRTLEEDSNSPGTYRIDNLPLGDYTISAKKAGYESASTTVTLSESKPGVEEEIGLTPEKKELELSDTTYKGPEGGQIKITSASACWHFDVASCSDNGDWSSHAYCAEPNAISYLNTCYTIGKVYIASDAINWLVNQSGAFNSGILKPEYMVAIWKLLGYTSGVGCTTALPWEAVDSLVNKAIEESQKWFPCRGDKVVVVIENVGQDVLVIEEVNNNWNPCKPAGF